MNQKGRVIKMNTQWNGNMGMGGMGGMNMGGQMGQMCYFQSNPCFGLQSSNTNMAWPQAQGGQSNFIQGLQPPQQFGQQGNGQQAVRHYYKIKTNNVQGNSYDCLDLGNGSYYIIYPNLDGICRLINESIYNYRSSVNENFYYLAMEYVEKLLKIIQEAYRVTDFPNEFTYELRGNDFNNMVPVKDGFMDKTLEIGNLKETVNKVSAMKSEDIKKKVIGSLPKASNLILQRGCYCRFTSGALQEGNVSSLRAMFIKMYVDQSTRQQYSVYIIHKALNNVFTTRKEISEIKSILSEGDNGYYAFQENGKGEFQSSDQNMQKLYTIISQLLNYRSREVENVLNAKYFSDFDNSNITNNNIAEIQNDQDIDILNQYIQACKGMKPVDIEPYFIRLFDVFKGAPQKISGIDDTRENIQKDFNEKMKSNGIQLMVNGNPQQAQGQQGYSYGGNPQQGQQTGYGNPQQAQGQQGYSYGNYQQQSNGYGNPQQAQGQQGYSYGNYQQQGNNYGYQQQGQQWGSYQGSNGSSTAVDEQPMQQKGVQ